MAEGTLESWGEQTNFKPMFRVSVSKEDHSYTLIQEGITLTEEQAEQIYHAYKQEQVRKEATRRIEHIRSTVKPNEFY